MVSAGRMPVRFWFSVCWGIEEVVSLFSFCCPLSRKLRSSLAEEGNRDWLSETIDDLEFIERGTKWEVAGAGKEEEQKEDARRRHSISLASPSTTSWGSGTQSVLITEKREEDDVTGTEGTGERGEAEEEWIEDVRKEGEQDGELSESALFSICFVSRSEWSGEAIWSFPHERAWRRIATPSAFTFEAKAELSHTFKGGADGNTEPGREEDEGEETKGGKTRDVKTVSGDEAGDGEGPNITLSSHLVLTRDRADCDVAVSSCFWRYWLCCCSAWRSDCREEIRDSKVPRSDSRARWISRAWFCSWDESWDCNRWTSLSNYTRRKQSTAQFQRRTEESTRVKERGIIAALSRSFFLRVRLSEVLPLILILFGIALSFPPADIWFEWIQNVPCVASLSTTDLWLRHAPVGPDLNLHEVDESSLCSGTSARKQVRQVSKWLKRRIVQEAEEKIQRTQRSNLWCLVSSLLALPRKQLPSFSLSSRSLAILVIHTHQGAPFIVQAGATVAHGRSELLKSRTGTKQFFKKLMMNHKRDKKIENNDSQWNEWKKETKTRGRAGHKRDIWRIGSCARGRLPEREDVGWMCHSPGA